MPIRTFAIPEPVRLRALAHGEAGRRWLAGLGQAVAALEAQWSIQVGDVLTGGSESLVVAARRAQGTPAVLKIGLPDASDLATEAKVLRLACGRGYAVLFAHDGLHNALLLERLGRPLGEMGLSIPQQIRTLCASLAAAWLPLASADGLLTGAEKAVWLSDYIVRTWQELGKPCAPETMAQALVFAEQRRHAFSAASAVLVHGDAHAHNALQARQPEPDLLPHCKFVDPDGLYAERAYDLAILMRGWNRELLAGDAMLLGRRRCALLAELTGEDERAIWQWGFVERVSTGLALLAFGRTREGTETLAVADRWQSPLDAPA